MPSAAKNGSCYKPHKILDFSFDNLNYNSVENVPGIEARAAFSVNSATVFKEDIDIFPTIVDETSSHIPCGQKPTAF